MIPDPDPFGPARGLAIVLFLGGLMWAAIAAAAIYCLNR